MKLTPTNRTDYAIRALIYLADHQGSRAKAADIASTMDIPTGFCTRCSRSSSAPGS